MDDKSTPISIINPPVNVNEPSDNIQSLLDSVDNQHNTHPSLNLPTVPIQYQHNIGSIGSIGSTVTKSSNESVGYFSKFTNMFKLSTLKYGLLVAILFYIFNFRIIDLYIMRLIPYLSTISGDKLKLNMVGFIAKSLLVGIMYLLISNFI